MHSRQQSAPPRRQAGSVAVYTAVIIFAILTATVLAIELGRIYQARQQYQKMASIAALDVAARIGGCDASTPLTQAGLEAQVLASLMRNGDEGDITARMVEGGLIQDDEASGLRYLVPSDLASAEAVRVTLTGRFPRTLTGLLPQNDSMRVSATALRTAVGAFTVGSGLIDADVRNELLGGMIGSDVDLTAVHYQGLIDADVSLSALALATGLDVQALSEPLALAAQQPQLSEVLDGLAAQLAGAGDAVAATALELLAQAAAAGADPAVPLGLVVGATDGTAADAPISNALELVNALVQAAIADDGGSATPIPVGVEVVPAVGTVSTFLRVLEPARPGVGRPGTDEAVASTAQVQLMVRVEANAFLASLQTQLATLVNGLVNTLLSGLGIVNVPVTVVTVPPPLNIGIDVDVAQAKAYLDRIQCPRAGVNDGDPIAELSAETAAATLGIGTFSGAASTAPPLSPTASFPLARVTINATCAVRAPITNACLLNLGSQTLDVTLGGSSASVGQTGPTPLPLPVTAFTYAQSTSDGKGAYAADGVPPQAPVPGNPQTVGSELGLGLEFDLNVTQTGTLGAPLTGLGTSVAADAQNLPGVSALLSTLNGLLGDEINPRLSGLGIRTGVADVTMRSVSTDQPRLVSTCLPDSSLAPPRGCPSPN